MATPVADLIQDLGGRLAVAESTGHKVGYVDQWKHRGRIPRTAWPELQQAFPEKVSLKLLLELETATPAEAHA